MVLIYRNIAQTTPPAPNHFQPNTTQPSPLFIPTIKHHSPDPSVHILPLQARYPEKTNNKNVFSPNLLRCALSPLAVSYQSPAWAIHMVKV